MPIGSLSSTVYHGYKKSQIALCLRPSPGCVILDEPVSLSLLYIPIMKMTHLLDLCAEVGLRPGPAFTSDPFTLAKCSCLQYWFLVSSIWVLFKKRDAQAYFITNQSRLRSRHWITIFFTSFLPDAKVQPGLRLNV